MLRPTRPNWNPPPQIEFIPNKKSKMYGNTEHVALGEIISISTSPLRLLGFDPLLPQVGYRMMVCVIQEQNIKIGEQRRTSYQSTCEGTTQGQLRGCTEGRPEVSPAPPTGNDQAGDKEEIQVCGCLLAQLYQAAAHLYLFFESGLSSSGSRCW